MARFTEAVHDIIPRTLGVVIFRRQLVWRPRFRIRLTILFNVYRVCMNVVVLNQVRENRPRLPSWAVHHLLIAHICLVFILTLELSLCQVKRLHMVLLFKLILVSF